MKNGIEIEVLDQQVRKKLDDLLEASGNVKPAMQVVGRKIKTKAQIGFRTGTDPWGKPWAPLSPLTRHGQPLRDSGRLMQSITAQISGDGVEIGTNLQTKEGVKYPAVHQFGAVITPKQAKFLRWLSPVGPIAAKKVTIPARPFLPLDGNGATDLPPQWATDVLLALRAHFEKATA